MYDTIFPISYKSEVKNSAASLHERWRGNMCQVKPQHFSLLHIQPSGKQEDSSNDMVTAYGLSKNADVTIRFFTLSIPEIPHFVLWADQYWDIQLWIAEMLRFKLLRYIGLIVTHLK